MRNRRNLISRRTAVLGALLSVIIIITVASGTVLSAVGRMAEHANALDDARSRETMLGAVETFRSQLGATLNDYAAWDDAVANIYDPERADWMVSNIGDMTADSPLYDVAVVIDTRRKVLMAYENGKEMEMPVSDFFDRSIWTLFDTVLNMPRSSMPQATGFIRTRSGIAATGVALIRMKSGALNKPDDQRLYLIFARHLDNKVAGISQTYVIDGLHLVGRGTSEANTIDIKAPGGQVLDRLSWPSRGPGTTSYGQVSLEIYSAIGLFGFLLATTAALGMMEVRRVRSDEESARRLSLTDRLSGLLNRAGLYRVLEDHIETARAERSDVALLYLDLDGFKDVNDTYGHGCGDDLIRSVAAGLNCLLPPHASLARLGGDEFAITFCVKNCDATAMRLAATILEFFDGPFTIGERIVKVGTSIGFASSQIGVVDLEELVRRADIAMYKAKESGRGRAFAYDTSMDHDRTLMLEMEQQLSVALEKGQLSVAFQPVVSAADLTITSVEALVRWTHPTRGAIGPDIFIPVAEKTGLIEPLGLFVLEVALEQAKAWPEIDIAVNISPVQLKNPNFAYQVAEYLSRTGIEPSRLVLELTEGYLIQNPQKARQAIDALKALGVRISLDDFGAGFSSIGYLRQFGFDRMKIDRSMISEIDHSEEARNILQATAALARSLNIPVTAEGVEREEQAMILHLCGCERLQGYLFGRPATPQVISGLLAVQSAERNNPVARSA